jgi:nickel/cobalt transporter (NiCoT) family protein
MKLLIVFKKLFHRTTPEIKTHLTIIFAILFLFTIFVWLFAFLQVKTYPLFFGLVVIAYGLGLRHAVDPDHIAAIDNTTRKLIHDGKKPVGTGFFFSLGHSTIVILLSIGIIYSTAFIQHNLPEYKQIGSLIGTIVSSLFLIIIGTINLLSLIGLFKLWRKTQLGKRISNKSLTHHLENRGLLTRILKPFLKAVSSSWHMYPIGVLFGLGFDTASEVGLLSISAATSASGMPPFIILLLPLAFTAGMMLIDSLDGILMLGAYGWAYINPMRKLYYNLIIVFISVIVAFFIGGIEALQIIGTSAGINYGFFKVINNIQLDNVGIMTIAIMILCWITAMVFYKRYQNQ